MTTSFPAARLIDSGGNPQDDPMDRVFFALSDPVDQEPKLVSELAAPFDISLQAVSRHIQVLVRAGLINQERTGRIKPNFAHFLVQITDTAHFLPMT
jgi:predicted transcriptional regulator